MKNFVQSGRVATLPAPVGGASGGDPVLVGNLFGVNSYDALEGANMEVALEGVFDLPSSGIIGQGVAVYWDSVAKKITATSATNKRVGAAFLAVGAGGTMCRVRLGFASV